MKRTRAASTTERDERDSLNLKRRRKKVKRNKQSDFKAKTRSLKDSAIIRSIIEILLPVNIVRSKAHLRH